MFAVAKLTRGLVGGSFIVLAAVGCTSPKVASLESQNRTLAEQSRAQLAEIANIKQHSRKVEDQLIAAEQQLAQIEQELGSDRKRLASLASERDQLQGFDALGPVGPIGVSGRLAELARRYPSLQYDPQTGISKLDTDILFDSADSTIKPDAQAMLSEFAQILRSPHARNAKIMVVGHTDELKTDGQKDGDRHADDWHLSTGRAVAVAQFLRQAGIPEEQMGVAGFAAHQPIAANETAADRQRNRRVEIFLVEEDVPIVGWTETMTRLY